MQRQNHKLDPYRNQVAELTHDGVANDYLFTTVTTEWDESRGPRWRRWVNPREAVLWEVATVFPDGPTLWSDGLSDPADEFVGEVVRGRFLLGGVNFDVRWLSGREREAAKLRCGAH